MSFASPHYLWLLLILPPILGLFFWWSWRVRNELMTLFIHSRLLPGLVAGFSAARLRIRVACLFLAVIALVLALARPEWGYTLEEVRQKGLDIVVAIDTSKSMLAEDIAPDRLARAKLAALDLVQQAQADRLGLVAFAGSAFLECPLTFDDVAFQQSLQAVDVGTIPEGGTALGAAIEEAVKAFKEGGNYKVLVLLTDGEDHDSGALEAANRAAAAGLRIFTIGIGSAEGDLLRIKGANGQPDYIRDENGNVVKSRLNETLLQQIAGAANGFYLPLRGANTMETLYQRGLAPLPKSESKERRVRRPLERYRWPLAAAVLLLIFEMLLPERKGGRKSGPDESEPAPPARNRRPPAGRKPQQTASAKTGAGSSAAGIAILATMLLLLPARAHASPSGALRDFKSGNYGKSLEEYEQALQKSKDDPRLHFNAGAAAYRDRQFDTAARHFNQVLGSQDLNLQEQAYYNLGNTLFRLGEQSPDPKKKSESWEDSLKHYESSLKLNAADADAKFNYEFVKRKLEQLKNQQQQNQQQNQKDNQNQPQDQKQDQDQNKNPDQNQKQRQNASQKQDQQQSTPKPSQPQQAQDQKSPEPQQEKQQPREQQPQGKPQEQKSAGEDKQEQAQAQANAAGQMTPAQAKRLLDSHKDEELALPVSRKQQDSADLQQPTKDW